MVINKIAGWIVGLALLILVWCIVANAYTLGYIDQSPLMLLAMFIFLVLSAWILGRKDNRLVRWARNNRQWVLYIVGVTIVLSVVFRLSFGFLEYAPTSDPESFLNNSVSLSTEGEFAEPGYVAKFPYLYTYNVILAGFMDLFGTGHMTVIILNTLLDFIAAGFLYLLMRNNKAGRLLALVVASIWITNPFSVLFSVLSLPLALFSTLLMIVIYLIHMMYLNMSRLGYLVFFSLLAGIALSVANSVRPMAVIFVIALFIFYVIMVWQNPTRKYILGHAIISFLFVLVPFGYLNTVHANTVVEATGYPETKNPAGWSLYVGTNLEYLGVWNYDDAAVSEKLVEEGYSPNESHEIFYKLAAERFASYSLKEKAELAVGKAIVLGGDQKNGIYNLDAYPAIKNHQDTYYIFKMVSAVFSWIAIAVSGLLFYRLSRQKGKNIFFIHYLAIVFIGLFFASLLVEVANRYFAPFFVFLIIFVGLTMKAYADNCRQAEESVKKVA